MIKYADDDDDEQWDDAFLFEDDVKGAPIPAKGSSTSPLNRATSQFPAKRYVGSNASSRVESIKQPAVAESDSKWKFHGRKTSLSTAAPEPKLVKHNSIKSAYSAASETVENTVTSASHSHGSDTNTSRNEHVYEERGQAMDENNLRQTLYGGSLDCDDDMDVEKDADDILLQNVGFEDMLDDGLLAFDALGEEYNTIGEGLARGSVESDGVGVGGGMGIGRGSGVTEDAGEEGKMDDLDDEEHQQHFHLQLEQYEIDRQAEKYSDAAEAAAGTAAAQMAALGFKPGASGPPPLPPSSPRALSSINKLSGTPGKGDMRGALSSFDAPSPSPALHHRSQTQFQAQMRDEEEAEAVNAPLNSDSLNFDAEDWDSELNIDRMEFDGQGDGGPAPAVISLIKEPSSMEAPAEGSLLEYLETCVDETMHPRHEVADAASGSDIRSRLTSGHSYNFATASASFYVPMSGGGNAMNSYIEQEENKFLESANQHLKGLFEWIVTTSGSIRSVISDANSCEKNNARLALETEIAATQSRISPTLDDCEEKPTSDSCIASLEQIVYWLRGVSGQVQTAAPNGKKDALAAETSAPSTSKVPFPGSKSLLGSSFLLDTDRGSSTHNNSLFGSGAQGRGQFPEGEDDDDDSEGVGEEGDQFVLSTARGGAEEGTASSRPPTTLRSKQSGSGRNRDKDRDSGLVGDLDGRSGNVACATAADATVMGEGAGDNIRIIAQKSFNRIFSRCDYILSEQTQYTTGKVLEVHNVLLAVLADAAVSETGTAAAAALSDPGTADAANNMMKLLTNYVSLCRIQVHMLEIKAHVYRVTFDLFVTLERIQHITDELDTISNTWLGTLRCFLPEDADALRDWQRAQSSFSVDSADSTQMHPHQQPHSHTMSQMESLQEMDRLLGSRSMQSTEAGATTASIRDGDARQPYQTLLFTQQHADVLATVIVDLQALCVANKLLAVSGVSPITFEHFPFCSTMGVNAVSGRSVAGAGGGVTGVGTWSEHVGLPSGATTTPSKPAALPRKNKYFRIGRFNSKKTKTGTGGQMFEEEDDDFADGAGGATGSSCTLIYNIFYEIGIGTQFIDLMVSIPSPSITRSKLSFAAYEYLRSLRAELLPWQQSRRFRLSMIKVAREGVMLLQQSPVATTDDAAFGIASEEIDTSTNMNEQLSTGEVESTVLQSFSEAFGTLDELRILQLLLYEASVDLYPSPKEGEGEGAALPELPSSPPRTLDRTKKRQRSYSDQVFHFDASGSERLSMRGINRSVSSNSSAGLQSGTELEADKTIFLDVPLAIDLSYSVAAVVRSVGLPPIIENGLLATGQRPQLRSIAESTQARSITHILRYELFSYSHRLLGDLANSIVDTSPISALDLYELCIILLGHVDKKLQRYTCQKEVTILAVKLEKRDSAIFHGQAVLSQLRHETEDVNEVFYMTELLINEFCENSQYELAIKLIFETILRLQRRTKKLFQKLQDPSDGGDAQQWRSSAGGRSRASAAQEDALYFKFECERMTDKLYMCLAHIFLDFGCPDKSADVLQLLLRAYTNRSDTLSNDLQKVSVLSWLVEAYLQLEDFDACSRLIKTIKEIRAEKIFSSTFNSSAANSNYSSSRPSSMRMPHTNTNSLASSASRGNSLPVFGGAGGGARLGAKPGSRAGSKSGNSVVSGASGLSRISRFSSVSRNKEKTNAVTAPKDKTYKPFSSLGRSGRSGRSVRSTRSFDKNSLYTVEPDKMSVGGDRFDDHFLSEIGMINYQTNSPDSNLPKFCVTSHNTDLGFMLARIYYRSKLYIAALKSLTPTIIGVELVVGGKTGTKEGMLELGRMYFLRGKIQLEASKSASDTKYPFEIGSTQLFAAIQLLSAEVRKNRKQQKERRKFTRSGNPEHHLLVRNASNASIDLSRAALRGHASNYSAAHHFFTCKRGIKYTCPSDLLWDAMKWFRRAWDLFHAAGDEIAAAKSANYIAKCHLEPTFVPHAFFQVPLEIACNLSSYVTEPKEKERAGYRAAGAGVGHRTGSDAGSRSGRIGIGESGSVVGSTVGKERERMGQSAESSARPISTRRSLSNAMSSAQKASEHAHNQAALSAFIANMDAEESSVPISVGGLGIGLSGLVSGDGSSGTPTGALNSRMAHTRPIVHATGVLTRSASLDEVDRVMRFALDISVESCMPMLLIESHLNMAELFILQGNHFDAVAFWWEARELFLHLFADGALVPIVRRATTSFVHEITALANRLVRFLWVCDPSIVNQNLFLMEMQILLSNESERAVRKMQERSRVMSRPLERLIQKLLTKPEKPGTPKLNAHSLSAIQKTGGLIDPPARLGRGSGSVRRRPASAQMSDAPSSPSLFAWARGRPKTANASKQDPKLVKTLSHYSSTSASSTVFLGVRVPSLILFSGARSIEAMVAKNNRLFYNAINKGLVLDKIFDFGWSEYVTTSNQSHSNSSGGNAGTAGDKSGLHPLSGPSLDEYGAQGLRSISVGSTGPATAREGGREKERGAESVSSSRYRRIPDFLKDYIILRAVTNYPSVQSPQSDSDFAMQVSSLDQEAQQTTALGEGQMADTSSSSSAQRGSLVRAQRSRRGGMVLSSRSVEQISAPEAPLIERLTTLGMGASMGSFDFEDEGSKAVSTARHNEFFFMPTESPEEEASKERDTDELLDTERLKQAALRVAEEDQAQDTRVPLDPFEDFRWMDANKSYTSYALVIDSLSDARKDLVYAPAHSLDSVDSMPGPRADHGARAGANVSVSTMPELDDRDIAVSRAQRELMQKGWDGASSTATNEVDVFEGTDALYSGAQNAAAELLEVEKKGESVLIQRIWRCFLIISKGRRHYQSQKFSMQMLRLSSRNALINISLFMTRLRAFSRQYQGRITSYNELSELLQRHQIQTPAYSSSSAASPDRSHNHHNVFIRPGVLSKPARAMSLAAHSRSRSHGEDFSSSLFSNLHSESGPMESGVEMSASAALASAVAKERAEAARRAVLLQHRLPHSVYVIHIGNLLMMYRPGNGTQHIQIFGGAGYIVFSNVFKHPSASANSQPQSPGTPQTSLFESPSSAHTFSGQHLRLPALALHQPHIYVAPSLSVDQQAQAPPLSTQHHQPLHQPQPQSQHQLFSSAPASPESINTRAATVAGSPNSQHRGYNENVDASSVSQDATVLIENKTRSLPLSPPATTSLPLTQAQIQLQARSNSTGETNPHHSHPNTDSSQTTDQRHVHSHQHAVEAKSSGSSDGDGDATASATGVAASGSIATSSSTASSSSFSISMTISGSASHFESNKDATDFRRFSTSAIHLEAQSLLREDSNSAAEGVSSAGSGARFAGSASEKGNAAVTQSDRTARSGSSALPGAQSATIPVPFQPYFESALSSDDVMLLFELAIKDVDDLCWGGCAARRDQFDCMRSGILSYSLQFLRDGACKEDLSSLSLAALPEDLFLSEHSRAPPLTELFPLTPSLSASQPQTLPSLNRQEGVLLAPETEEDMLRHDSRGSTGSTGSHHAQLQHEASAGAVTSSSSEGSNRNKAPRQRQSMRRRIMSGLSHLLTKSPNSRPPSMRALSLGKRSAAAAGSMVASSSGVGVEVRASPSGAGAAVGHSAPRLAAREDARRRSLPTGPIAGEKFLLAANPFSGYTGSSKKHSKVSAPAVPSSASTQAVPEPCEAPPLENVPLTIMCSKSLQLVPWETLLNADTCVVRSLCLLAQCSYVFGLGNLVMDRSAEAQSRYQKQGEGSRRTKRRYKIKGTLGPSRNQTPMYCAVSHHSLTQRGRVSVASGSNSHFSQQGLGPGLRRHGISPLPRPLLADLAAKDVNRRAISSVRGFVKINHRSDALIRFGDNVTYFNTSLLQLDALNKQLPRNETIRVDSFRTYCRIAEGFFSPSPLPCPSPLVSSSRLARLRVPSPTAASVAASAVGLGGRIGSEGNRAADKEFAGPQHHASSSQGNKEGDNTLRVRAVNALPEIAVRDPTLRLDLVVLNLGDFRHAQSPQHFWDLAENRIGAEFLNEQAPSSSSSSYSAAIRGAQRSTPLSGGKGSSARKGGAAGVGSLVRNSSMTNQDIFSSRSYFPIVLLSYVDLMEVSDVLLFLLVHRRDAVLIFVPHFVVEKFALELKASLVKWCKPDLEPIHPRGSPSHPLHQPSQPQPQPQHSTMEPMQFVRSSHSPAPLRRAGSSLSRQRPPSPLMEEVEAEEKERARSSTSSSTSSMQHAMSMHKALVLDNKGLGKDSGGLRLVVRSRSSSKDSHSPPPSAASESQKNRVPHISPEAAAAGTSLGFGRRLGAESGIETGVGAGTLGRDEVDDQDSLRWSSCSPGIDAQYPDPDASNRALRLPSECHRRRQGQAEGQEGEIDSNVNVESEGECYYSQFSASSPEPHAAPTLLFPGSSVPSRTARVHGEDGAPDSADTSNRNSFSLTANLSSLGQQQINRRSGEQSAEAEPGRMARSPSPIALSERSASFSSIEDAQRGKVRAHSPASVVSHASSPSTGAGAGLGIAQSIRPVEIGKIAGRTGFAAIPSGKLRVQRASTGMRSIVSPFPSTGSSSGAHQSPAANAAYGTFAGTGIAAVGSSSGGAGHVRRKSAAAATDAGGAGRDGDSFGAALEMRNVQEGRAFTAFIRPSEKTFVYHAVMHVVRKVQEEDAAPIVVCNL